MHLRNRVRGNLPVQRCFQVVGRMEASTKLATTIEIGMHEDDKAKIRAAIAMQQPDEELQGMIS